MTSLAAWEQAQQTQLDQLRSDGAAGGVVLQLLQTSCLLELAKLNAADLDLRSFATAAVEILTQFLPVGGVAVRLDPPGLTEVAAGSPDMPEATTYAIALQGVPAGCVAVDGVPEFLADSAFFQKVADQLSATFGAVMQGEELHRRAAVAQATRLAIELDGACRESDLRGLLEALLELPGVNGATLAARGPAFANPVAARVGKAAGPSTTHDRALDSRDCLAAEVWWAGPPAAEDIATVDEIISALATSVERLGRNQKLIAEAEIDPLTGVGNRRRASQALVAALNLAGRQGDTVAVLALDLDRFKQVNDTLGHAAGDAVLQTFSRMLERQRRAYDTVARMGGEEFLVICPATNGQGAQAFAERLRLATTATCAEVLPRGWEQTVSIGIALYPFSADNAEDLLVRADEALYEAKRAGRDTVSMAPHLGERAG